jgi:xanthine dehydrogenase accessory factor
MVREGRAASLATVVGARSDAGAHLVGTKMLVPADGSAPVGSIQADIDASLVEDAASMLREERSAIVERETPLGLLEIFVESFPPPQRLVIVGAVHVAVPLARLGKMLGYHVTVVDPRDVFATRERFPEADEIIVEWPEDALPGLRLDRSSSVAVLTHDPKIDVPALKVALDSEARYIGALGSRTTFAQRKADLAVLGATEEQLARIHAPIGLKIGARTPAEIALAVMGEIVARRRLGES